MMLWAFMIPGVTDVATEVSVDVTGFGVKGALVISVERISAQKTPTFRSQTVVYKLANCCVCKYLFIHDTCVVYDSDNSTDKSK